MALSTNGVSYLHMTRDERRALDAGPMPAEPPEDDWKSDMPEPRNGFEWGADGNIRETSTSSWQPVDLTAALNGEEPPAPTVLRPSRGHHLLYEGRTHWFQGASETMKSWIAAALAAASISASVAPSRP